MIDQYYAQISYRGEVTIRIVKVDAVHDDHVLFGIGGPAKRIGDMHGYFGTKSQAIRWLRKKCNDLSNQAAALGIYDD